MADPFSEAAAFVKIAEAGSLSTAAQRLGLSVAATSRRLAQLESRLGTPLIRRNSRYLTLTEEGEIFHAGASRALAEMEAAELAVSRNATDASGTLRVTTTVAFGRRRLAPLLQRFAMLHPEVQVHLETSDKAASIIETGFDLAICFDTPPDSRLQMKRLADNPRVMCAAPAYLDRRGRPRHRADLTRHDCILIGGQQNDPWLAVGGDSIRPRKALSTNDGELARVWALDGAGIVIKSLWDVAEDIEAGHLEEVLPEVEFPASPVVALFAAAQGETAKVRYCLRFLAEHLRHPRSTSPENALSV
ncbi:LysR family transcriptional regulator [Sphingomonas sp.]|uniref:LysR family transcriptional regulator n=1 Tax=Sphingomonas sp. TaxID=28214 RepID=UPI003B3AE8E5